MEKLTTEENNQPFNLRKSKLRLPKMVESDFRGEQLLQLLTTQVRPLWKESELEVFVTTLSPELTAALRKAHSAGQVVRSLENAERVLDAEKRGIHLVDRRSDTPRGGRISRLLLLADDGSERFYRQVESLLRRHGNRVLAVRLEADADTLGESLYGPNHLVRLLMLVHKKAVCKALLSMVDAS